MDNVVKLNEYVSTPILQDINAGESAYLDIREHLFKCDKVIVDFTNINGIISYCINQIFGELYNQLGDEQFHSRIDMQNASPNVLAAIQLVSAGWKQRKANI
jgi:hypothetical protein